MFGKMIEGKMNVHTINNLIKKEDGGLLLSNDPDVLSKYGYKELIYTTPEPKEGYIPSNYTWIESDNSYTQEWLFEIAPEPEPTIEERLEAIEGAFLELIQIVCGGDA